MPHLEQQTQIEDLKNRLNAEMEENREHHRLAGGFGRFVPNDGGWRMDENKLKEILGKLKAAVSAVLAGFRRELG